LSDVTRILSQIESGDPSAAEQLLPLVYEELRKLAAAKLAQEKPGQTLQATALVHEAYLRLVDVEKAQCWDSRGHFFAAAAEAMRRILVEMARKNHRREAIRGPQVPLDDLADVTSFPDEQLLRLDEALQRLESQNGVAAQLVKLRFFAGLSMSETAEALGVSMRTAERTWTYARTWIHRALENPGN
jgi:RNA polymerase sigma factor (TIGR02999 family)